MSTPSNLCSADQPYDVCIVGAGAAGISLALELDGSGLHTCILEAGRLSYDKTVQQLFQGEVIGDRFPPLGNARVGALGGTTLVWAGWCRPLEAFELAGRAEVGSCPWPFSLHDLEPSYQRAADLCGLVADDHRIISRGNDEAAPLLPLNHTDITHHRFCVHAVNFGEEHRQQLEKSANISVHLNSPVIRLVAASGGDRIQHALVRTLDGRDQKVTAKAFVLTAGGIENARLLLLSADSPDRAPGNSRKLVGRYFADHPFVDPGELVLTSPSALVRYFPRSLETSRSHVRDVLSFREQRLRSEQMLNGAIFFYPRYESHPAFATPEVKAFLELINRLRRKAVPGRELELIPAALGAPRSVATAMVRRLLVKPGSASRWRLRAMFESEFRYENQIQLTIDRDSLGRPRPRVRWRLSELDLRSMARGMELLDRALRKSGAGRIELAFPNTLEEWRAAAEGGKHHMGTTRMHRDPTLGVVDPHSRVNGTTNLYVTGSSVFPSGGYVNPTLTIVALAVRLAKHLKTNLKCIGE